MENENLNEEQLEEAVSEITEEPAEPETETAEEVPQVPAEEEPVAEETVVEEQSAEEPAKPQMKKGITGNIAVTVILCVALAVCLLIAVLAGTGVLFPSTTGATEPATGLPQESTADTTEGETTEPIELKSYSVDDETAVANADKVVATIGDVQLTNGELQTCYQMGVYNFVSANQYYLAYMGVDFTRPLDQQVYDPEAGTSWQEFLLEQSFKSWHLYTVLNLLGQEAGFELDEEGKTYLTDMEETMKTTAAENGYESIEAMLQVMVAPGTTEQGYRNYMAVSDYAYRYYSKCAEDYQPTAEQLEQYFTENEEALTQSGITKDAGSLVDVRHILIQPEGGTEAEDGTVTYSDEEWEICRQKAQDILDQWKNGDATEESFGELAKEHTADGNGNEGGLYEDVSEGQMVTEFNDWIFDESRAYGDTDLVKTSFGYHVMYFVDSDPAWEVYTAEQYVYEKLQEMVDAGYEKWPMEIDYDAICLGQPDLG